MGIRNTILCCGLLPLFFSGQAVAIEKEVAGASALELMQALRLAAGINPKVVGAHGNFTADFDVDSLDCHTAPDDSYGLLEIYDCKINSKTVITGAPAKLLHDAMMALKIPSDDGMSQTRMVVKYVHCRSHPSVANGFYCQWQE